MAQDVIIKYCPAPVTIDGNYFSLSLPFYFSDLGLLFVYYFLTLQRNVIFTTGIQI